MSKARVVITTLIGLLASFSAFADMGIDEKINLAIKPYSDAVAGGLYDPDGGGRKAAKADMEWYSAAGQLTGDPASLNIEDFWYLAPLDAAKAK